MKGLDVLDRTKMRHLKGRAVRILSKETGILRKSGGSGRETTGHHGKGLPLHFATWPIDDQRLHTANGPALTQVYAVRQSQHRLSYAATDAPHTRGYIHRLRRAYIP